MTREETIKSIAKTIHRVEFPNSACWFSCNKCSYNGNCDYLKAAEIVYQQYVEQAEIETARKIFAELDDIFECLDFRSYWDKYSATQSVQKLKKKYRVED